MSDLVDLVRRAHGGEVLGVELFGCLAETEPDGARRERLLAAQLLEQQTLAAAARLASDLGIDISESDEDREAGRRAAEYLATLDWSERMKAIAAATGNYRTLYSQLTEVVPDPSHPSVTALVQHERALNAFAAAEGAGDPNALDILLSATGQSPKQGAVRASRP